MKKMKSQCDGCHAKAASMFCYTEEIALCKSCDSKHHGGASLARDHQCFPFHYPPANQFPTCEICQETRAFIFCLEHRAVTCRICDNSHHATNKWTMRHNRFLLTGATLYSDDHHGGAESPKPAPTASNTTTIADI